LRKRKVFDRECEWMADKFQRGDGSVDRSGAPHFEGKHESATFPHSEGTHESAIFPHFERKHESATFQPDVSEDSRNQPSSSSQPPKRKDEGDADNEGKRAKSVPPTSQK